VELDLRPLAALTGLAHDAVLLFSESNSRFLIEVPADAKEQFLTAFASLPCVELGQVQATNRVRFLGQSGTAVIDADGSELKQVWKRPLAWD
jgi:phosphoribosylformylglycinamidine synthase